MGALEARLEAKLATTALAVTLAAVKRCPRDQVRQRGGEHPKLVDGGSDKCP